MQQSADHAVGQQHAAASEVADEVEGHDGFAARLADGVQGAGQGDVVHVVSGGGGQRPVLPPAGHPPVDGLWVAGEHLLGADAESLGHARPEALEQPVGGGDQAQDDLGPCGGLEVHGDAASRAEQRPVADGGGGVAVLAVYADHLRAHVSQHHPRERSGADAGQLDDAHALKRSGHGHEV